MRWILIPARGGSKEVPRKNLRELGGRPLIRHVLDVANEVVPASHILVSTDDDSIARVCAGLARVVMRPEDLSGDGVTLDEVATHIASRLLSEGASPGDTLITIQPTSPFIRAEQVEAAFGMIEDRGGCVLSVADDRHLRWEVDAEGKPCPLFEARVNRQWLPRVFAETGGIIGARLGDIVNRGTRIGDPVSLLEIEQASALDIDSFSDWAVAEYYASRRRIVIRADAGPGLGMGHAYRALALEHALAEHDLTIVTRSDGDHLLGADFLHTHSSRVRTVASEAEFEEVLSWIKPDIVVLDVLDTTEEYVRSTAKHASFVVTIENLGEGARAAGLVINDLYTDVYPGDNHWYGVKHAILGPQFELLPPTEPPGESVERILVTFGGTDPQHLTAKALTALQAIGFDGEVTVVLGPGYSHGHVSLEAFELRGEVLSSVTDLAVIMHRSQLAITSAGRTVTELMTQGVPTIAMCQNERELMHTHASSPFGVTNLGLGEHVDPAGLGHHIAAILESRDMRLSMHHRMLKAVEGRSNKSIAERILSAAESARRVQS